MYPQMRLKTGKERSMLNRHPWIFSGAVQHLPEAEDGDIVEVTDSKQNSLGFGFFAPRNQIICRMFEFSTSSKPAGQGQFDFADKTYWQEKIRLAMELRRHFTNPAETNSFRLLHAEGDFFPGIIIDLYNGVAVVQLLIQGTQKLWPLIFEVLNEQGIASAYLRYKTSTKHLEQLSADSAWEGKPHTMPLEIMENKLRFKVNIETGQKTGFFLDQKENRALLQSMSAGKKVLNAFCYTGGFSVYAAAGGAAEVNSVDISKDAVQMCEENMVLNFGKNPAHSFIADDCFDYMRKGEDTYDIIVLDPPAFAKNARSVPNACRGYKEINMLAFKKVRPQGLVFTFSCSQNISRELFQKVVFSAAADAGRNVRILKHLTQPYDHPINIFHPESEYLKGLLLYVE